MSMIRPSWIIWKKSWKEIFKIKLYYADLTQSKFKEGEMTVLNMAQGKNL